MRRVPTLVAAFVVAVGVAGACGGGSGNSARPGSTSTVPTTLAPTATTTAPTTLAPTATTVPPTPTEPSCPPIPARRAPREDRSRYTLRIDVKPAENVVEGETAVRFTPDVATDKLVLRLWANSPRTSAGGARLDVGGVSVGGRPVDAVTVNPTTVVAHPGNLLAGQSIEVRVPWRLTLPGTVSDRISRTGDAIRLGSFFPILAWEPGIGWAEEPPSSGFSEAATTPAADFTATVTVPDGFDVLATGTNEGAGRWTATGVGDFALSVGHFTLATGTAHAPQPVPVTVGMQAGLDDDPKAYVAQVIRALEENGRRFGAYPWPTYTMAVTPVLNGGIEYPMHVLQGPGTLGRTTSHEVSHMWFYGLVANNQGRDPWLDEGLATYAEGRIEGSLATMEATAIPAAGKGRVGEPMSFWEARRSIYYRSVYVQGAQTVAALGDVDLVDCALRYYVAANAYQVARPKDLLAAAAAVFPDGAATLARFGVRP